MTEEKTQILQKVADLAHSAFRPLMIGFCPFGVLYALSPLYFEPSFFKLIEVIAHIVYITGLIVLIIRIEACKSVRGISEKMIGIQSIAFLSANITTSIPALSVRTFLSFSIWYMMRFRYPSTLDSETDDLTLHIVGAPTIAIGILYSWWKGSFWGCSYACALYLTTCQNLYQVRMLQIYCEKFNDKILSKAMSAHFVFSTVAFKAITCVAASMHNYRGHDLYLFFSVLQLLISCNFAYYYLKMNKQAYESSLPR